jgi:uncharacterized membrane protein YphA (DoxX/SURF4 family)
MFPSGPAGVALLLLRLSVAALIVTMIYLNFPSQWLSIGVAIVAVALLVGMFARLAAALCAALVMLFFLTHHARAIDIVIALHTASAVAVALLGPGAYSVDAYLFGRRVIEF